VPGAAEHLRAIARAPRPAGGEAEAAARRYARGVLEGLGFGVSEEPFEYSTAVARFATPMEAGIATLALAFASWLGARGHVAWTLAVLVGALAFVGVTGVALARRGVLGLPIARRAAVNLVARRGERADVAVWLVAHLDSKSQGIPMLVRIASVVATAGIWVLAIAYAAAQLATGLDGSWWEGIGVAGVIGAVPLIATTVGSRSPGAIDDASGVATVLAAAEQLPGDAAIGVVLTSAEELGLAGARAWAARRAPGVAINVDGIDDRGDVVAMYTRAAPVPLVAALAEAADSLGCGIRVARTLPGVLTDGVALAEAGWHVVTLSRGTWETLACIHTPRDTVDRLDGSGASRVAQLVALTAEALT
jgi:peptidase M28-like protein